MPWIDVRLNDGNVMPTIAFGSWTAGSGDQAIDRVEQALEHGFSHLDTAQSYRNEVEVGRAIRESGLSRDQIFVTTKFSGTKDVESSIMDSLSYLGLSYVDLYLVHHPRLAKGNIPGLWTKMEKIKSAGYAKSIGVSNFSVDDLKELLASAKVVPVVNQIYFQPYVWRSQSAIHTFGNKHGIITEAYSALTPVTHEPGGPLDAPLKEIGGRLNATPDQILLAWVKAKGAVAVTYSTKAERLEGYIKAGDLELSKEDVAKLDEAGAKKVGRLTRRVYLQKELLLGLILVGLVIYGMGRCLGIVKPIVDSATKKWA